MDDDQRIALTISDEAAVDDEQMHHNDANKYIALTRSDDEQRHNNDGTTYEVASRRDAKQCTEVHHNTVHYEAAEDKLSIHDDELSQEYFMSNEFEVQSEEEEVLLEREHKERECTSDDLDSNAPIASLATKNSRNAPKTIFDRSKAVHPPIVGTIVKKKGRSMGETKADNINDKEKINITKRMTTSTVHNMNQSTSGSKSKRTRSSKNSTNESGGKDPFFGTHVAFSLAKETGKKLICELGKKFIYDAVCFDLDNTAGHIVGIVMRHQKGTKGKGYQVVWEYSGLGESCLPLADILEGQMQF